MRGQNIKEKFNKEFPCALIIARKSRDNLETLEKLAGIILPKMALEVNERNIREFVEVVRN